MGQHMQAATTVIPIFVNKNGRILWKLWKVLISDYTAVSRPLHRFTESTKYLKAKPPF